MNDSVVESDCMTQRKQTKVKALNGCASGVSVDSADSWEMGPYPMPSVSECVAPFALQDASNIPGACRGR